MLPSVVEGSAASLQECAGWWQRFGELTARANEAIVLVDANTRLGSELSASVGSAGFAQSEDAAGRLLRMFLIEHDMCAPATILDSCSSLEQYTWTSSVGGKHRLDYVLVPHSRLQDVARTEVLHNIDWLQRRADHRPVCLEVVAAFARRVACQNGTR